MAVVNERLVDDLGQALQGLADVLGVALVLTNADGEALTDWQRPSALSDTSNEQCLLPLKGSDCRNGANLVRDLGNGQRRFVVPIENTPLLVQSDDLPKSYPWVDGQMTPQDFPGQTISVDAPSHFVLRLFISAVCRVIATERSSSDALPIDDVDVENIRRIGVSLRRRIDVELAENEHTQFSLEGIPGLERFFFREVNTPPSAPAHHDLTDVFDGISAAAKGSLNLMSLSGDFVVQAEIVRPACGELRKSLGEKCFASDIEHLVKATLSSNHAARKPKAFRNKCHARFDEVFAPIFTDGLIVGLIFGGQLLDSKQTVQEVHKYIAQHCPEVLKDLTVLEVVDKEEIERTEAIVASLAALISLLFERSCLAMNQAALREVLVGPRADNGRGILDEACRAVKRLLGVSECAAFKLDGNQLILAAITSRRLVTREKPKGPAMEVEAKEAIGKAFYTRGEGLTGSIVVRGEPRFERDAHKCEDWAGKCSDRDISNQCFAAPIKHEERFYGVLRAVKPSSFSPMREADRQLIAGFANELGIVMRNRELASAETQQFKEAADSLQALLAKAAHEFKAPLHHVLQLSTALRLATSTPRIAEIHQMIKEEIYRAKRVMENYLLRGVQGREEMRYDFRENSLSTVVKDCVARFRITAARRDMSFKIAPQLAALRPIVFDKESIERVFTNIIDNAVKYGYMHTEILVSAKEKENTVTVTISDMGLGIPKEAQGQIFEGYQRSSAEEERFFKPGTGLGLMIAKEIVERHDGNIYVESEPFWDDPERLDQYEGFTTRFTVTLPKSGPPKRKPKANN